MRLLLDHRRYTVTPFDGTAVMSSFEAEVDVLVYVDRDQREIRSKNKQAPLKAIHVARSTTGASTSAGEATSL